MMNAVNIGAVHTHTHTHTHGYNLIKNTKAGKNTALFEYINVGVDVLGDPKEIDKIRKNLINLSLFCVHS